MNLRNFLESLLKPGIPLPPSPRSGDSGPRAAPRVRLLPLHQICFLPDDRPEHRFPAANISVSGVGLMRGASPEWPSPGALLAGHLQIGERRFAQVLRAVHATRSIVGFAFENPDPAVVQGITRHLDAELAAMELRELPPEQLERCAEGTPHWFQGPSNTGLYYVEEKGEIVRFHLAFFANYLEGGADLPVRFGEVVSEGPFGETVRWQTALRADSLTSAIRFLMTIPNLPPAHRERILKLIY